MSQEDCTLHRLLLSYVSLMAERHAYGLGDNLALQAQTSENFWFAANHRNQRVNGPQHTIHTRAIERQSHDTRRNASDHISRHTVFLQMKWYLVVDDISAARLLTVNFPLIELGGPGRTLGGIVNGRGEERRPRMGLRRVGEH